MGGLGSGGHNQQKECAEDYPRIDSYNIDKPRKNVQTETVPCNYGGHRIYYICPRCGKRYRFLYLINRHYLCRDCAGLNYWTQQNSGLDLAENRVIKLLDRLQFYEDYTEETLAYCIPDKPPNMHWNTYERLIDRLSEAQGEYIRQYNSDSVRNLCFAASTLLASCRTKSDIKGNEMVQTVELMLERIKTL